MSPAERRLHRKAKRLVRQSPEAAYSSLRTFLEFQGPLVTNKAAALAIADSILAEDGFTPGARKAALDRARREGLMTLE